MAEDERDLDTNTGDPDTGDAGGGGGADTDPSAEVEKWKRLARHHEDRAKANADAAIKLKQIEDAGKSEIERLTEQQRASEARAAEAESRALRLEVAAEKGLTPVQAKRLVGSTREELESDADELLATFKSEDEDASAATGLQRRPREVLRAGARPQAEPEETDPRKLAASLRSW